MTVRERILRIRLMEKLEKKPEYAQRIGVSFSAPKADPRKKEKEL